MKYFKISSTKKKSKLVGKQFNEYLKTFLKVDSNNNIITNHLSPDAEVSFDELLNFLQDGKETIKLWKIIC